MNVVVEYYPELYVPKRKIESVSIPGRNGDILFIQDAYENEPRTYDIYISAKDIKLHTVAHKVAAWLLQKGYLRLEDTYEPEYYRLAYFAGGFDIENLLDEFGRTSITFSCKPQKFLKRGENVITVTKGQTLRNPTAYSSKPLIRVNGSGNGVLTINGNNINLTGISEYLYIDSDIMDCYKGTENCNNKMTGEFPELVSGNNVITWSGNITGVQLTPRWFTI